MLCNAHVNQLAPHDRTDVMSRRRDKHGGLGTTHVANGVSSPASAAATAQQQRSSGDRGGSVTSANMVVVVVVVVAALAAFGWSTLTLHGHGSAQANAGSLLDDAVVHATAASSEASTCASSSSPSSGCDGTDGSNDVTSATLAEAVQREAVTTPVVDSGELSKSREGAADEVAPATATSNTGVGGSSDNSGSTSSSSSGGGSGVGGDGGGSGGGGVKGKQVRQWSEQYHALTLDLETLKLVFRDLPADNFGALGRIAATGRTAKVRKSGFTHACNEHTHALNRGSVGNHSLANPRDAHVLRATSAFCNHGAIPSLASMRPQPPLCVSV
jgi:hypothetical protein